MTEVSSLSWASANRLHSLLPLTPHKHGVLMKSVMIGGERKPVSKATSLMRPEVIMLMLICNQGTPRNGCVVC